MTAFSVRNDSTPRADGMTSQGFKTYWSIGVLLDHM